MSAIHLLIALLAASQIDTGEACTQKMDLCFVLDSSTDVCKDSDPCENWDLARQFCSDIAATLDVRPNLLGLLGLYSLFPWDQVALATFSNKTEKIWDLNKYTAKDPLLNAIIGVPFKGGVFNNLASTIIMYTQIFNAAYGDEVLNKDVTLMVTNGVPGLNETEAKTASLAVQGAGITMFVVCITGEPGTTGCNETWAASVASIPTKADLKTYFIVPDYPSLPGILEDVLKQICDFLAG